MTEIKNRQDVLEEIYEEHFGTEDRSKSEDVAEVSEGESVLSDEELVIKAKDSKNGELFTALWKGDTSLWDDDLSKYPSQSEADLALCSELAFWTRKDREQMDRLFRDSGLMREKWERDDYRKRTLDKAIEDTDDVYEEGGWSTVRWMYDHNDIPKRRSRYRAVRQLRKEYTFATIKQTDELLVYEDGVYTEFGDKVVREVLDENLDEHCSTYEMNEVVGRIKASSYHNVDEFRPDLDDPKVCLENGVLHLDDMRVTEHSPEHMFLTKIPVKYDPEAECPEIEAFLDDVVEDEADEAAIYETLAHCLWPGYIENKFLILYGDGANGKSTLLSVIRAFLGDATTEWDIQDLADNRFAAADLHGALANVAGDLPSTKLKRTGTLKKLTGGDAVMAEKKHKPSFSFENRAKLIFAANRPPVIDDPSYAISRRLMLVEMPYTFTREEDDNPDAQPAHLLRERLTTEEELSGLLNKALDALQRLKEEGFTQEKTPQEVREEYTRESDPIARFAQDCLVDDAPDRDYVIKEDVVEAYNNWAEATGAPTKDERIFHRELQKNASVTTRTKRISLGGGARRRVYRSMTFTEEGWRYAPTDDAATETETKDFDEML